LAPPSSVPPFEVAIVTPEQTRRNVLLPARGCYFGEDEVFARPRSANSPGREDNDAIQEIARGSGNPAPLDLAGP
jgi:hypothetical protein